ncbi:hypothetical protein ACMX2H_02960 [Arthrobacter sulfonylureivorans]|uniref:hypothetical protein n=1 Tax=Arthrobacter sulfonylureivorans TaxID=2486855 RepID=UPI0039E4FBD9
MDQADGAVRPTPDNDPSSPAPLRSPLRLAATLLFAGVLVSLLAGLFHPDNANANDHAAAFSEYASSAAWTGIHLAQFVGMAILIAGLLVLFVALDLRLGAACWLARFAAVAAIGALALYAVLQAVDGVALKHAVDAWAAAPEAAKGGRFDVAEGVRWLEWGVRSYQSLLLGLSLVLFAVAIIWSGRVSRFVGSFMGLTGFAYLVQGWVVGTEGFSPANTIPTLVGIAASSVWSIWLLISAWRHRPRSAPASAH